jgi:hypothetical protein
MMNATSAKIMNFPVPPKSVKHIYKGQEIKLTYRPATSSTPPGWHWEARITKVYSHSDEASKERDALKAAQRYIDNF